MKLKKIVDVLPALQKLSATDLSPRILYRVRKLIGKLEPEIEFYNAEKNKILDKYRDESRRVRQDDVKNLEADIIVMLDVDVDIDVKTPVIPDTENYRLSNNDITLLEGLVEFEFDDKDEGEGN